MSEQTIVPDGITVTVDMDYRVSGYAPIRLEYGSNSFVPASVRATVINGEIQSVKVWGGQLLKTGAASEKITLDNRYSWSSGWNRDKAPAWLRELAERARDDVASAGLVP